MGSLVALRQHKPTAPTLGEWLDTYLDQRTDVKPATRKALTRTQGLLVEHFGEARDTGTITVADAKEWRAWLQTLTTKRIVNDEPETKAQWVIKAITMGRTRRTTNA